MRGERSMSAIWGAIPPTVDMRCSSIRPSASSARQRSSTQRVDPVRTYHGSLSAIPTWAKWVEASMASPPPQAWAPAPRSIAETAARWRTRNVAPRATPVVPDVKQIAATRSASSSASRPYEPEPSSSSRPPGAIPTTSVRRGSPSAVAGSQSATDGRTEATSAARSDGPRWLLTAAWTAPRRSIATAAMSHSAPEGRTEATTSPGPTPAAASAPAARSAARSSVA